MSLLEAKGLAKAYKKRRVVNGVTFSVSPGEIVGLLGLNGAGKTTLMRIVACLLTPTAGSVVVDGNDVVERPDAVRRLIGHLPEEPPLYQEMKVRDFSDAFLDAYLAAETIEAAGGLVLADTCLVVAPVEALGIKTLATNSAKAASYLPSYADVNVYFAPLERCIEISLSQSAQEDRWITLCASL